jgi:hypothetical protein
MYSINTKIYTNDIERVRKRVGGRESLSIQEAYRRHTGGTLVLKTTCLDLEVTQGRSAYCRCPERERERERRERQREKSERERRETERGRNKKLVHIYTNHNHSLPPSLSPSLPPSLPPSSQTHTHKQRERVPMQLERRLVASRFS